VLQNTDEQEATLCSVNASLSETIRFMNGVMNRAPVCEGVPAGSVADSGCASTGWGSSPGPPRHPPGSSGLRVPCLVPVQAPCTGESPDDAAAPTILCETAPPADTEGATCHVDLRHTHTHTHIYIYIICYLYIYICPHIFSYVLISSLMS